MIRNIIFDMGGVLLDLNGKRCQAAFEAIGANEVAEYVRDCRTEDLFEEIEEGTITTAEFCNKARTMCGCDANNHTIIQAWESLLMPPQMMKMQWLLFLREAGYRVFLLSNTNDMHWQHASLRLFRLDDKGVGDMFERAFLSHEMHIRKPNPDIYRRVLQEADLNADETIFIDDNLANVKAAEEVGITPFHETPDHQWLHHLPHLLKQQPTADNGYCATIGFFDGVHQGHQYVIGRLRQEAFLQQQLSMVITFAQHPAQVLRPETAPKLLTTAEEKRQLLTRAGIDNVVMLDFTRELAALSAREFMQHIRDTYQVRTLLIGYDNRFGSNRNTTFADYERYGAELGINVILLSRYGIPEQTINSTTIRQQLQQGHMALVNDALGRPFTFDGTVVHGRGEGHRIGFPTANLLVAPQQLLPARGVYSVEVDIEGGTHSHYGMMNIGVRPTYGSNAETIEVHILDFDGDIYGRQLRVRTIDHMRAEKQFSSIEQLIAQLEADKESIRRTFCL